MKANASMVGGLVAHKDDLKMWVSLAIDAVKLVTVLAGPIGLYHLVIYLNSVNAPLPVYDLSTAGVLITIASVSAAVSTMLLLMLCWPVFVCSPSRSFTRLINRARLHPPVHFIHQLNRVCGWTALSQSSALLVLATYCVLEISRATLILYVVYLIAAGLIGGIISGAIFQIGIARQRGGWVKVRRRWLVFSGSLLRGFWCFLWVRFLALFYLAIPFVSELQGSASRRILTWLIFLGSVSVFYCLLTSGKATIERAYGAIAMTALLFLLMFPREMGKRTLQFLGIGGGIPVNVLLKTMDPSSTTTVARMISACLIMNAGNRVIIRRMDFPTEDACSQDLPTKANSNATMFRGVEVLSGSDIIGITGYTPMPSTGSVLHSRTGKIAGSAT